MRRCPICNASEIAEQPQPSLHAFTTIFECGCRIDQAFGSDEWVYDQRCDEPMKQRITDDMLKEMARKAMEDPNTRAKLDEVFRR